MPRREGAQGVAQNFLRILLVPACRPQNRRALSPVRSAILHKFTHRLWMAIPGSDPVATPLREQFSDEVTHRRRLERRGDLQQPAVLPVRPDHLQPVAALPRDSEGVVRQDILQLIAMNQMTELDALVAGDAALDKISHAIAAGRLNFSDRRIAKAEPKP